MTPPAHAAPSASTGPATRRVLVAMSGGVDSAVTAALVRDAGHEVVGVTMRLWGGDSDSGCCSVSEVDDARWAADRLGIDHLVFNFAEDFDRHVVDPYVDAHRVGLTPNPCIECNRHLKFDRLFERAHALGFDAVATGHHARVIERPLGDGRIVRRIARGEDPAKDQSYVLYMLSSDTLAELMLPIGHMTKAQVREQAARLGLAAATKPDSQDVCFITKTDGRFGFLGERAELTPASVIDQHGHAVAQLDAIELVTLGQRKGLGLSGEGERQYVTDIDRATRTVHLGPIERLSRSEVRFVQPVFAAEMPPGGSKVLVQVSAHGQAFPAALYGDRLRWHEPQRVVAPGQSVVFYDAEFPDEVLGGAVVTR